ncbi:Transcription-associated protein 1 [Eumeta japonica]|uniref:Transcription-associated protein 1 n=1 Tax=Eumeta variegata TaxID=151549 RepID=A0A4C2A5R9_EUMVA|nr:Transcription-associated protein 1 [Eumeta japonica]
MMIEPQRLEYRETEASPPAVQAYFQDQPKPLEFEVDKVIETAFTAPKSSTTDPFHRQEVLRCYLAFPLCLEDDKPTLQSFSRIQALSMVRFNLKAEPNINAKIQS